MSANIKQELPTGRVSVVSLNQLVSGQITSSGRAKDSGKTIAYFHNLQDALLSAHLLGAKHLDISNDTKELLYPLRIYAALSQFVCARIRENEYPAQPEQLFALYSRVQFASGLPEHHKPATVVLPLKNVDLAIRYFSGLANIESAPEAKKHYYCSRAKLIELKALNFKDVGFAVTYDGVVENSLWDRISSLEASVRSGSGCAATYTGPNPK